MRAMRHARYGAASDVLEMTLDAPMPDMGDDDLLVRVLATSVNPIDCAVRSGYGAVYWEHVGLVKQPHIPGRDISGEVVGIGGNVHGFKIGDAVWAGTLSGGTAEFASVPQLWAAPKPASLSFIEAGALPYVALTAWTALVDNAGLTAENCHGKLVIVPRGAGGVGSFAIQLLKAWGAHVASTCSTRNVELVRSLGADIVIDYTKQDFSSVLRDYDVAFDTAFDCESKLLGALKTGADAVYVSIVSPKLLLIDKFGLEAGLERGDHLLAERVAEQAAFGRRYAWSFMRPNGEALRVVGQLVDAGKIKPVIDSTYGLPDLAAAHMHSEGMRAQGKIAINIAA